jgi:sn-glycerol 3-phosphate transport system permease protein
MAISDDTITEGGSVARRRLRHPSPERRGATFRSPRGLGLAGRYALLGVVTFVVLFPVYTTVVAALKPSERVLANPLVPDAITFDVLREAWGEGRLGRFIVNSLVVAVIVTAAQVTTSVLSGYAFAMLDFPGRNVLFVVFLATLLVPFEATLVVNRRTIDSLGWLNSYQGLAVPFLATAFGTFLLRQAFMGFPGDLHDAARIDGAGHIRFLWNVALPVIRPTIGALALFGFLASWNQYLWPNLITTESDMNTVQSGLRLLRYSTLDQPNLLMAGTVIAAVPIFVALLVFQRQLVRGLTAGAVKG